MAKKILIVDDDPQILSILEKRVKLNGYEALKAMDGKEALHQVGAHMPDLIILDIMMPHMDGTEVARRLKEDAMTKNIPIIYVTALKTESDDPGESVFDTSPVFGKPFNSADLMKKIEEMLSKIN